MTNLERPPIALERGDELAIEPLHVRRFVAHGYDDRDLGLHPLDFR
jgi:hypothetical protein